MIDHEGPIHRAILQYLRMQYPRALIFHPANELGMGGNPKSKAIAQAKDKRLGMLPGAPDIMMLFDGLFYGFEIKAAKGKVSDAQSQVGAVISRNGGRWAVVRSIGDVQAVLAREGDV